MKPRVLIIEDNEANMDLARYLLEAHGFDCDTAPDGEAGLLQCRARRPGLVICDLQLPGMDGFEVLRQLRADDALKDMPVIAVTAYAMVGDRDRVLAAGFDGYLAKPLDPERFVGQIHAFLGGSGAARPRSGHVLIVDDHPVNLELLETVLGYGGHSMEAARDGVEALARAARRRPDLIITDLLMPNMDGEELCRRVRADPALATTPIVIHTASYRSRQARQIADRVGVRWVLPKPSEPAEILAVVAEALGIDAVPAEAHAQVLAADDSRGEGELAALHRRTLRLTQLLSDAMQIAEVQRQALDARLARDPAALAQRLDGVVNLALRMSTEREPPALMAAFCAAVQDLLSARYVGVTVFASGGQPAAFVSRGLDEAAQRGMSEAAADCPAATRLLGQPGTLAMIVSAGPADFTGLPAAHPPVHNMLACAVAARDTTTGWVYAADRLGDDGFSADDERLLAALASTYGIFWGSLMTLGELDRRVADRTRDLAAANAELGAFASVVSHDLRAPLAAIGGFGQALSEKFGAQLPPDARRYLDKINGNARTMSNLIDDLLDFSRTSHESLVPREVDLAALADDCLEAFQVEIRERGITVLKRALPRCHGDSTLLRQVLANLLGNAVKYTRQQAHPVIEVGSRTLAGDLVVFVRDNGVGFDMAHAGNLFKPFSRIHSSSEFEGSGIGLALVQQIVGRHGGRVWAEAAPGEGACFTFTLPVGPRA